MNHPRRLIFATIALCVAAAAIADAGRKRGAAPRTTPTYSKEISRIVQKNCESCHRTDGSAPFALSNFNDVAKRARLVKFMTMSRQMPPWKPVADCGEFAAVRSLTSAEIAMIAAWVDGGAPEGNRAELPSARTYAPGWSHGVPDLLLPQGEAWTPASHEDSFRVFVVPKEFKEDTFISAIDFLPRARKLVHHVVAYVDTSGKSEELDLIDPGIGYDYMKHGLGFDPYAIIGIWLPNSEPLVMPDGVAARIPKGARVVLQVHYHPYEGHTEADVLTAGIYFPDSKPKKLLRFLSFAENTFVLPPGERNIRVATTHRLEEPIRLLTIGGHMHSIGRKITLDAIMPDGREECLLRVDDWDPAWQGMYTLKNPKLLPAGTILGIESFYDNSLQNPRQPNHPPREVRWGEPATEEMCISYMTYIAENEDLSITPSSLPLVTGGELIPMLSTGMPHTEHKAPATKKKTHH